MEKKIIKIEIETGDEFIKEVEKFYEYCLHRDVLGDGSSLFKAFNIYHKPKEDFLNSVLQKFCLTVYAVYIKNNKSMCKTANDFGFDDNVEPVISEEERKNMLSCLVMFQMDIELSQLKKQKVEVFSKN